MIFPRIFEPFSIGALKCANRIVMPPMVIRKARDDGEVTPELLRHYKDAEGPGLVVVEASVVSPEGRLDKNQIGIFDDIHVEGLAGLSRIIHDNGAAASIQIHHAGRNTGAEAVSGLELLAPSAYSSKRASARAMTEDEIQRIISSFVSAARRARDAGFDAVEVHAAHGYLISQFLSPLANRRADRWGGSLENRARFLRSVLSGIRREVPEVLAYCRLGVADGEPGGLPLVEGIQVGRWLEEDGIPLIHVSSGIGAPPAVAPEASPYSNRFHLGIIIKKALGIPVIGIGDIRSPERAESALAAGAVDLVAVGRALLVDPRWVAKAREGKQEDIIACRSCAVCHRFPHPERCPAGKEKAA